jgi:hypothetical protein
MSATWRHQERKSLRQRFEEKYIPEPNSGCWLWMAALTPAGYGMIGRPGGRGQNPLMAHRASWELHRGPIPEGLHIDHLCRNPACVNPDHLEPVTQRENLLRGVGISALNSQKTHCVNGHEFTAENTYIFPRDGTRQCRACRREADAQRKPRRRAA